MKKSAFIIILLISTTLVNAQIGCTCLPEGIHFQSQSEIYLFKFNYPGCNGILGDVRIGSDDSWSSDITNLMGLSKLVSIGGDLSIINNTFLYNLTGLENLTTIGGDLSIDENLTLHNLTGLENLATIGGDFNIGKYYGNTMLQSLTGLEHLDSIGGDLWIVRNDDLTSLTGLDSLNYIGGELLIRFNTTLTSLTGLDNLEAGSVTDLCIYNNTSLSHCEVQSICDYLANPNGSINIYGNATGCNNAPAIANFCGVPFTCLPYGNYYFVTQTDIDSFKYVYPGCTELEGSVTIRSESGSDITNLSGLYDVTSIGSRFEIYGNEALTSLAPMENLTYIGGALVISYNDTLTSLTGLENITSIGGGLSIGGNDALTSLTGLDNLTSIGGGLEIYGNDTLTSLAAMENLASIGDELVISDNNSLTSLSGLENIISIGSDLSIYLNSSLCNCEMQWLCDYLSNPNGVVWISNNADGCNSVVELANACGGSMPCLPYGDYILITQADIDGFQSAFPNCTELQGSLRIYGWGSDISNLNGLNILTSIGGGLWFYSNSSLTSLTGLENLTSIGDFLYISSNEILTSLTGLDNLASVGGNLAINGNDALTSLTELADLASIGGYLEVWGNDHLTSLSGLDNLDPSSITELNIRSNPSLSECEVQSICDYLAIPNGSIYINENAPGCNSPEEVELACETVGVGQSAVSSQQSAVKIYPNPAGSKITLECESEMMGGTITIYNLQGQEVLRHEITQATIVLDIGHLPPGMYFYHLTSHLSPLTSKGKLVKSVGGRR